MKKILDFIKEHPALKASIIEVEAGIPKRGLSKALAGHQELSANHAWGLCESLCKYGLEIDGWKFKYDSNIHSFFLEKKIEDRDSDTREIEEDGKTSFEYYIPVYRKQLEDEISLINFLKH